MKIHVPRMFFFMLMRGRNHRHPPQYEARQERLAKALQRLQVKTPQQLESEKRYGSTNHATGLSADRSGSFVVVGSIRHGTEPSTSGAGADRPVVPSDRNEPVVLTGQYANWKTLEEKLLEIVRDNPDISEVELDEQKD